MEGQKERLNKGKKEGEKGIVRERQEESLKNWKKGREKGRVGE